MVMTPRQFARKMEKCKTYWTDDDGRTYFDYEETHADMDELMCELLESLGYSKGVDIFKDTDKWYC